MEKKIVIYSDGVGCDPVAHWDKTYGSRENLPPALADIKVEKVEGASFDALIYIEDGKEIFSLWDEKSDDVDELSRFFAKHFNFL